jgi:Holliday junction DNA helicase RuvA
MIGSIRGRLTHKEADRVLVETGGVGYLLHIPFSTFFALGEVGGEVALGVHTHVREDALQLFGFASDLELQVFHRLIGVSGVGPKMAINILSGIPAEDLVAALRASDVNRLTAVPGLGKKTSERLVLELKDKLQDLSLARREGTLAPSDRDLRDDAVSALVNLSYRARDAEEAVDRVQPRTAPNLEALLKAALAVLAR